MWSFPEKNKTRNPTDLSN